MNLNMFSEKYSTQGSEIRQHSIKPKDWTGDFNKFLFRNTPRQ